MTETTRLDEKPKGFFLDQFDESTIQVEVGQYRQGVGFSDPKYTHYGTAKIDGGGFPFDFNIYFPAFASGVEPKFARIAKSVLRNIGKMDAKARAPIPDEVPNEDEDLDHDIAIAYVHVDEKVVQLHYHWTTFNAEFFASFERNKNGTWKFLGT